MRTDPRADAHLIFLFCLGVFSLLHWLIYVFWYPYPALPSTHLIGLSGLWLAFRPRSTPALIVVVLALAVDGWVQAPVFSNHTALKNFMVLGLLVAGIEAMVRGKDKNWILLRVAPYGGLLLIGLYFFGVFHKINSDFLNPGVSCAVALWQQMPLPEFLKVSGPFHLAGIYGTFIIETLIAACLLIRRLRLLGIAFGIGFHMLLATSSYEFYSTFSILTIALHTLFLHPHSHRTLIEDPGFVAFRTWAGRWSGQLAIGVYCAFLVFVAYVSLPTQFGVLCWAFVGPLIWIVWKHGRQDHDLVDWAALRSIWVPALFAVFLLNGFSPYLGMKTAQSFNMFANLRLEGGVSNHLVFPNAPEGYLADVVEIIDSRGVPWFGYIEREGLALVYYDFLNHMERAGDQVRVSYRRDGEVREDISPSALSEEFDQVLHPRWVRKWFHFVPVDLKEPKQCAIDR